MMNNNPGEKQPNQQQSKPKKASFQKEIERSNEQTARLLKQIKIQDEKIKRVKKQRKIKQDKIYRKSIANQYTTDENEDLQIPVDGQLTRGSRVFMIGCANCHGLQHVSVQKKIGPSLGLIYNRKAGSDVLYSSYSDALVKSNIYWTSRNLFKFMYNPKHFIKGTSCGGLPLKSEEDRADLIQFLKQFSKEMLTNLKIREVKQKSYTAVQSELYANEQTNSARRRPA